MQGYIFINSDGEYAAEGTAGGFARTEKVIWWVKNLNEATVFRSEKPWGGVHKTHLERLKHAQALKAVEERTVKLTPWVEEVTDKAER